MKTAEEIAKALGLTRDPEKTWSREIFRSPVKTQAPIQRRVSSSRYLLISAGTKLPWTRSKTDEIWSYHAGASAIQLLLFPDGTFLERVVGPDPVAGDFPQSVVPGGVWHTALVEDGDWGLFGVFRTPAGEPEDLVCGNSASLAGQFPEAAERMRELDLI